MAKRKRIAHGPGTFTRAKILCLKFSQGLAAKIPLPLYVLARPSDGG
jgi:hypothetical protein